MPYYVLALEGFGRISQLGEHAAYRDASAQAKALRAAGAEVPGTRVKVIFAPDRVSAEDLLLQPRDARPEGADD